MAHDLIASDRVEGTRVFHVNGREIGTVQRLMIDKVSGRVEYAVITFGGFLGLGQKHFPVPWSALNYSVGLAAYEIDITEEQLGAAPSFAPGEEFDWGDRADEIRKRGPYMHSGGY